MSKAEEMLQRAIDAKETGPYETLVKQALEHTTKAGVTPDACAQTYATLAVADRLNVIAKIMEEEGVTIKGTVGVFEV